MGSITFADHLATLGSGELTTLLAAQPDVLVERGPRGFVQLAQRLDGPGSISAALHLLTRDTHLVGQAIAVLADAATVPAVARLLDAAAPAVYAELSKLCGAGLVWLDAGTPRLPDLLHHHWSAEFGRGRPLAKVAKSVYADDLQAAMAAWGVPTAGLRKPESIESFAQVWADPKRVAERIAGLPALVRACFEELCSGFFGVVSGFLDPRAGGGRRPGTSRVGPADPPIA